MNHLRQVISGALVALISISIVLGGLSLAFIEGDIGLAQLLPSAPVEPISTSEDLAVNPDPGLPTVILDRGTFTATPTLAAADGCPLPTGWVTIQVNRGDTLQTLASAYGVDPAIIKSNNCLEIDELPPGGLLYVPPIAATATPSPTDNGLQAVCGPPPGWILYSVKPKDNLYRLGLEFGVTFEELQWANCLGNSRLIVTGSQIYVPPFPTPTPEANLTPDATLPPTQNPTRTFAATVTQPAATATPTAPPPTPSRTMTPTGTATNTSTATPTTTRTATPGPTPTPTTPSPLVTPQVTFQLTVQIPE